MVQRTLLNLLRLLGPKPEMRRALLFSLGLFFLGPKPERRRALLFSLGFFFFYLTIRAFLGGLTWSKTLYTHIGTRGS